MSEFFEKMMKKLSSIVVSKDDEKLKISTEKIMEMESTYGAHK